MPCTTTGNGTRIYGALRSVYFLCGSMLLLVLQPAWTMAEPYAELLVAQSASANLAAARDWDVLLHYRPHGSGRESIIDDPRFFLSPAGRHDPAAELAATIRGFSADAAMGDEHPRCRFPARYEWLRSELHVDVAMLPEPVCAKLDESLAAVDPRSAVLVFPAAHNNGPASMFGHTLLRIGSSYKSELLSYAVNYAAHSSDTNGLIFAYKGIFGKYPGYYSILPYYEKVKEYNDLEHRDVWEYALSLTAAEVRRMVLHIWELQGIASEYYFFDENCSFMLLFLLESARPSLRLTEEYWQRWSFWVIPADTIGTLRRAGLIEKVAYRPAQATRITHRSSLLPAYARDRAYAIAMLQRSPVLEANDTHPVEERRQVLDLAAEFVQYRYSRKELEQAEFQRQFLPILRERSTLGKGDRDPGKLPEPPQPEAGHQSGKFTAGGGVREGKQFTEVFWRPAYHDLLDPEAGYTKGAQINFMSVTGRYYPEQGDLVLQSLRPVDILSLAPRDRFFQPISWKVNGGLDRKTFADGSERLFLRLNTGGGFAWEPLATTLSYVMAEADLNLSDRFTHKTAVGGGISAGLLTTLDDFWKIHLAGTALFYAIENHQYYRLALDQHFKLSRTHGLEVRASYEQSFNVDRAEALLNWAWYF